MVCVLDWLVTVRKDVYIEKEEGVMLLYIIY